VTSCASVDPEAETATRGSELRSSAGGGRPAGHDARPRAVSFSRSERGVLHTLSPLPEVPADPTNAYADSRRARRLGRELFCDPGFSGPLNVASDLGAVGETGKVSCASCHSGPSLDDRRSSPPNVSVGAGVHTRNAPGIVNSSFYAWTNWGGRFSAQWELPLPVTEAGILMNSSRLAVAHRIFDEYRASYERIFGALEPAIGVDLVRFPSQGKPKGAGAADGAWESMTPADQDIVNRIFVNYGKALAAYFRAVVSEDSAFDQFVAGDRHALSLEEQRGAQLFIGKAGCVSCHSGSHFSDDEFHNLGLPAPTPDDGRFRDVPPLFASPFNASGAYSDDPAAGLARLQGLTSPMPESARGAFRTAGLRGVAFSAPYMHAGQLATLQDVVDFYDAGGGTPASGTKDPRLAPLGLSPTEKADLVAFLYSLTGEPVPERLLCQAWD
jgi:cytochrome c peroxidase